MAGLITGAALTALILRCAGPSAPVSLMHQFIMQESGGNPNATHVNANGSIDYGLSQINSTNLSMLEETPQTILDPCRNVRDQARLIATISRYNTGSPTAGIANGYVQQVLAKRVKPDRPVAQKQRRRMSQQLLTVK